MKPPYEQIKSHVKFLINHGIWIGWYLCWWLVFYHLEPFSLNYFSFSPPFGKMNFIISLDFCSLFLSFSSLQVHKSQLSWFISNSVLKVSSELYPNKSRTQIWPDISRLSLVVEIVYSWWWLWILCSVIFCVLFLHQTRNQFLRSLSIIFWIYLFNHDYIFVFYGHCFILF